MICKRCGHEQGHLWFEPVYPPSPIAPTASGDVTNNMVAYKRWACRSCGRYHFADGSLYSNPYSEEPKG